MRNSYARLFLTTIITVAFASLALSARGEKQTLLSPPQKAKVDDSLPTPSAQSAPKPRSTMLLDGRVTTQAEQILWSPWHEAFHKAVIENQTELLKHNRAIRYGLAVVEYKVTKNRQLKVRALPHNDPTYKKMAAEALSSYNLDALRKDLYLAPNEKFDSLVVKCYERLNNKKILAFPDNSERNEVSDVHWRTDDYEQVGE
jgi:hypothetical protein